MKQMEVWAHRGASGYMPENTMEAFELAIEQKADGIELDVQLSRDGEIMVFHDESVDRVTNSSGLVKDFTSWQLKEIPVKPVNAPGKIYRIPTLSEVLDLMRHTDMKVNIELKNSVFFYEGMEEKVIALVKDLGMKEQIIYSSFNHYSLRKIREIDPGAETGLLMCDGWIDEASYGRKVGVNALHPAVYHLQYPDFAKKCREQGLKLHVWTANQPEHFAMVKAAGADAVITNYPDKARDYMNDVPCSVMDN